MEEPAPASTPAKYGVLMMGCIAGAVILLGLKALPGFFAFIAGGLLLFFGFGILASKNAKDKIPGIICIITGALTVLSIFPYIKRPAGWLLNAGAIALFVLGIWNGIQFVLSLKNRS